MATLQRGCLCNERKNEIIWRCPKCGVDVHFPNENASKLSEQAGGCQGCLAKETFERKPGMFFIVLEFWMRTNRWPESNSWMEAIPFIEGFRESQPDSQGFHEVG